MTFHCRSSRCYTWQSRSHDFWHSPFIDSRKQSWNTRSCWSWMQSELRCGMGPSQFSFESIFRSQQQLQHHHDQVYCPLSHRLCDPGFGQHAIFALHDQHQATPSHCFVFASGHCLLQSWRQARARCPGRTHLCPSHRQESKWTTGTSLDTNEPFFFCLVCHQGNHEIHYATNRAH